MAGRPTLRRVQTGQPVDCDGNPVSLRVQSGDPNRCGVCGEPSDGDDHAACVSGPGNAAVEPQAYQASVAVRLQCTVDRARRLSHTLGTRPYRVFLVWQERDRNRTFREVRKIELMPVKLVALDSVDLQLEAAGLTGEGGVTLREISPAQVSEDDLKGRIDGADWAADDGDREFFYEVQRHPRCEGRDPTERRRFVLAAEPHLDGGKLQYRVQLVDQEIARDRDGNDRTVAPTPKRPQLVT